MLGRKPKGDSKLDAAIERVLEEMETVSPESEEYGRLLTQLTRLNNLKPKDDKSAVSGDVLVTGAFGFLNVLLIIAYEQKHVWVTKALTIVKPKT